MVAREFQKLFVRAQRDGHEHEHGRHGHEILVRHNEENAVGTVPLCFGERLGMVTTVGASRREGHRAQRLQRMRRCTAQQWILPRQVTVGVSSCM